MALDLGTLRGFIELDDQKFDETLDKLPEKVKGSGVVMGLAAGAAALGIGAALSQGIETAVELDGAKAKLSAQLGFTAEESARIGGVAGKLYSQNFGDSIDEVNDAVANVVSSIDGMRSATETAIDKMTAKALNFNSAFGIDTARSTQVVGQLIKSGLVKDGTEGFDLLTKAAQKVPANVREDLLDAADEYGPFFQQLGFSGQQAFSLLVEGAAKGSFGIDKAGDALKEFSIRATDLNDTGAQQALAGLGLSGTQMADDLLAGGDRAKTATQTIVQALQSVQDPGKQAALAGALFGTQIEDLNKGELPKFLSSLGGTTDALGKTKGAADAMGKTLNGGVKSGWQSVQRQFDGVLGQIGQLLLPALKAITDVLNDNPALLNAVAIGVGVLAAAFIVLTVANWALNTSLWATAAAMLANPITWIVLAVIALIAAIVLLVANWDTVVKFLTETWNGFVGWITGVMDGLASWWTGVWDGFVSGVTDAWNGVVAWFAGIPDALLAFFQGANQWLLDAGKAILSGIATGIALAVVGIKYFFTQFPLDLINWLVGAAQWLVQTGADILTGLANGITTGWNAVVAWFTALPQNIWNFLVSADLWLLDAGSKILQGLANGVQAGWNFVVSWFTAMPGNIMSFVTTAGKWLLNTGATILSGLLTGLTNGWNGIVTWFQNLPATIAGFVSGAGKWLWDAGKNVVQGLLDGIKSLGSTIGGFFLSLLPSWIVGPFKAALGIHSPSTVFREFGRNIAQGIPLGLDDEQSALDKRVSDLVSVPETPTILGSGMMGGMGQQTAGAAGMSYSAESNLTIMGNVGWNPDEVQERIAAQQRMSAALAGLYDSRSTLVA